MFIRHITIRKNIWRNCKYYQYHTTDTEIKNCYNYSEVTGGKYQGEIIAYNWAYSTESSPKIENVFYTNADIGPFGSSQTSIGTPTYYELPFKEDIITNLNNYIDSITEQEIEWKHWFLGSEGYPIFE